VQQALYTRPDAAAGAICRLVAVGDLMLSGDVSRRHRPDQGPVHLFDDVSPILRSGDIVFGNLETPLCDPPVERTMFRAHPAFARTLAAAGFNLLSLANNHILEYGPESLRRCARAVSESGIAVLGAGENQEAARRPVIMDRHGLRVGFLGFGRTLQAQKDTSLPGFVEWDEDRAVRAVRDLKGSVDLVVVSIHIGYMWLDYPSPEFKAAADRLLAEGAHVLLMHHAHVLQGYQVRDGRLAIFNLGNFIADITEGETKVEPVPELQVESAIFLIDLDRRGVVAVAAVPIMMTPDLRIVVAPDDHARRIIDRNERIAREIDSGAYRSGFWRQRAELNTGHTLDWLVVHLKNRDWRELGTNLAKTRPHHLAMLARYAVGRLETLWKRL
jgi:poly-gamma-glutamate capsule biosynthesis protein CapA/YwtB (metallophosphatase superfamily)